MDHGRAVTKHYLAAQNSLDSGYWDEAYREEEYFLNQEVPFEVPDRPKGRCVGELDVALVNWENNDIYVKEVKTSYGDLSYAEDQLERVDDHFEDWTVYTRKVLER